MQGDIFKPFIALIPKVDELSSFGDFCPISICNCLYKIIAKVIALRLKPILSKNILKEKFGFMEGRKIHEAIAVAQEFMHIMKRFRRKRLITKIDLSKAYDKISFIYIRLLLTHLGFDYEFIIWVMGCITDISFAILINGVVAPFPKSEKGLRQGCPLSPLLFVLAVEALSRMLLEAKRKGNIKDIEVAINVNITHLLFIDDILMFSDGNKRDILHIRSSLYLFLFSIGMSINIQK